MMGLNTGVVSILRLPYLYYISYQTQHSTTHNNQPQIISLALFYIYQQPTSPSHLSTGKSIKPNARNKTSNMPVPHQRDVTRAAYHRGRTVLAVASGIERLHFHSFGIGNILEVLVEMPRLACAVMSLSHRGGM
ncbi:hypothetical protein H0G86_004528 [Trichoderma simmonsii]|uniref:Uncharacterized protein n=1 Tax=Trichoderma simmonsii TaxID=1491479 RepID=A0A8G0L7S5_9HYPO|nr:hypothetical protein H0G86_004528 [Trichoderma simmonsii]